MKKTIQAVAMSRVIVIDYYWRCESFKKGIPQELVEALEETAFDRIQEQMKGGIVSGELYDYINLDVPGKKTPEDGWECHGGWNLKNHLDTKLSTVNVIEMNGDSVLSLASYQDDEQGNRLAEIRFHDLAMENIKNLVEEDVESYIEDGFVESGTFKLLLVHSTEPTK